MIKPFQFMPTGEVEQCNRCRRYGRCVDRYGHCENCAHYLHAIEQDEEN